MPRVIMPVDVVVTDLHAIMSIERAGSGPPIVPADPAMEREQLVAANRAFAAALKKALQSGAETSAGVLATVSPKRGKSGILAL
jgi:hypothetical protein